MSVRNRRHSLTARVVVSPGGAEGVLVAMGTVLGGWSFHLLGGRLRYVNNFVGAARDVITWSRPVPEGPHTLVFRYDTDGSFSGRGSCSSTASSSVRATSLAFHSPATTSRVEG